MTDWRFDEADEINDLMQQLEKTETKADAFEVTARIQGAKLAAIASVLIGDSQAPSVSYVNTKSCPKLEAIRQILIQR